RDLSRAVGGHHDDGRLRRQVPAARDRVEAVHVRQPDIQQDEVIRAGLELVEQGASGRRHLGFVALPGQRLPDDEGKVLVVFGDEDALAHGLAPAVRTGAVVGRSTMNVVSDTPSLSTVSVPRCASTMCRAMGSPSPVPRALVVKKGWKMRSRISGAMPAPGFSTGTRPCSSPRDSTRTRTVPLSGEASSAFSIRLVNT